MKFRTHVVLAISMLLVAGTCGFGKWFHGKSRKQGNHDSTVMVDSGRRGCKVDIDGVGAGVTGTKGALLVSDVHPGNHYLHVQCPTMRDVSYFISPQPGHTLQVNAKSAATASRLSGPMPRRSPATDRELRHLVTQAVLMRSGGQFKQAVELLRKAAALDPRNGDLHRELGITFLMFQDWERARVEMLETIRREPNNAEAHSGLAYALEKLGNLNGALKQYRICTRLAPHDALYHEHYVEVLGMLYAQQKHKKH